MRLANLASKTSRYVFTGVFTLSVLMTMPTEPDMYGTV